MPDRTPGTTTSHAAPPAPGTEPSPRRARHRAGWQPPSRRLGALWPLAALLVVGLAGARTVRGLPLPDDGALTAPAAGLLRGTSDLPLLSPEGLAAVHAAVYATVTRAFERHATLAGAGRELLLVLLLTSAALVWGTARRGGLGQPASAVAVLAFGAVPTLVPAHAVSTPAALGITWLLLGTWLAVGGRTPRAPWPVAGGAIALGTLLTPDVLLLGTAGLAAAVATGELLGRGPATRRLAVGTGLAAATVAVRLLVARWDSQPQAPGRWAAGLPDLLLVTAALLAVALLTVVVLPPLRTPAVALAATTLLAVAPPWGRLPALLLCLPVAALLLAAALEHVVGAAVVGHPGRRRTVRLVAVSTVGATAAVTVLLLAAAPRSDLGAAAHRQLVAWVQDQLPPDGRVSADATLRAELVHAGAAPSRVGVATDVQLAATAPGTTELRVESGDSPVDGAAVARFDPADGLPALSVVHPDPAPPDPAAVERRRALARALLANPQTAAPGPVADVLSSGAVDPRLLSLLAGIGARFGVALDSLPVVPGEEGRTLVRSAVITGIGGTVLADDPRRADRLLAWVDAQREPYAPDTVRRVDQGVLVTYRWSPDPDGAVARTGGR
ncbi:thioesterase domain-containing protein [Modestobacter lapidis]|nr:hypothetical protein [Modestobacter lapidis]